MEYSAGGRKLTYTSLGEKRWGDEVVLLENAVDLTANKPWSSAGFTITKLFSDELYSTFINKARSLLITCWRDAGLSATDNFPLDQYHTLTGDLAQHLRAVEKTKLLDVSGFPIPIELLETRISEICETPLVVHNPFDQQRIFHFRVIRPNSADNNPLHRDVWLDDYDNCVNLYIPIAGSSPLTSLILLPGSHRWPESRIERTATGADINGIKFNVPAVTAIRDTYTAERPSPGKNEVLVFSPYLIHGGSINSTTDQTRISIEIRLWKR